MYWLWIYSYIIGSSLYCSDAGKRTTSKFSYDITAGDEPKDCDNFENTVIDMSGLRVKPDGSFSGTINLSETLGGDDEIEIVIEAFKDGILVRDFAGTLTGNICHYLNDKHAPWNPIFAAMKIESCPIEAKSYDIDSLKFISAYAEDGMFTHEMFSYVVTALDEPKDCDNFENTVMDMSGLRLQPDGSFSGTINVSKTLGRDGAIEIVTEVFKDDAGERDFAATLTGNICIYLNDKNAPWNPIFTAMKIGTCPIEAKSYDIDSLKFNSKYGEDGMFTHEMVGVYYIKIYLFAKSITLTDIKLRPISCHSFVLSITEVKQD